jgi:predicted phosphohydrolase
MKLIWCSDIHLNFIGGGKRLPEGELMDFYNSLKQAEGEAVLITGDIAEGHNVVDTLQEMSEAVGKSIYFVLGNHDFYGSSVEDVHNSVKNLGKNIKWIPKDAGTPLSDSTILLGVDGWGDCRNGDYENCKITMSDWLYIKELNRGYRQGMAELKKEIQFLADRDAKKLDKRVRAAIKKGFTNIILATHVPPFANACYNAGRKSTPDGLCFWSSQILGTSILPLVKASPEVSFTWLCGHTHSGVTLHVTPNLTVKVAQADYYYPTIEEELEYD